MSKAVNVFGGFDGTAVWCDSQEDFDEPSYVEEATPELAVAIWERHLKEVHG